MPTQEPVGNKRVLPCSHACDISAEPTWVSEIYKWTIRRSLETRRGRVHNKLTQVTIHSQPSRAQTRMCLLLCVLVRLPQTPTELLKAAYERTDHMRSYFLGYSAEASAKKSRARESAKG